MRRASSKLLSHIRKPHARTLLSLSTRDIAGPSPLKPHLKSCPASQSRLFSNSNSNFKPYPFIRFQRTPSRNPVDPLAQSAPKRIKEEAFESAESLDEMLAALKEMETCFEDLAMACLKFGQKLACEALVIHGEPQKITSLASRALKVFDESDDDSSKKMSLPIAMALHLLGFSSFHSSKFNESLDYLSRANSVLSKLEEDNDQVLPVKYEVHRCLFKVKKELGREEEAILDLRKALEIKERLVDDDDEDIKEELGRDNLRIAQAYVSLLNYNEALPFCLKALEIHMTHFGQNSMYASCDRRVLGAIYIGLDEHGKALEQFQLSKNVSEKKMSRSEVLFHAEMDIAYVQIAQGRYDKATNTLKGIVQQTEEDSKERVWVFTTMAKALRNQEKFADTNKCLETACSILEKKERSSPLAVVNAYMEIATEYEAMNEFETAVELLKKALSMLEKLPKKQQSAGTVSARIGQVLLLVGKAEEAISYLEHAVERLKGNDLGVGYVYNNLGAAYMELGRPQSAAEMFMLTKEVMDFASGLDNDDSLVALQNLSKAYAAMRSYPLALDFQEKAIEGWRRHWTDAEDELNEAIQVLEELKQEASNLVSDTLVSAVPPLDKDEDSSVENSKDEDGSVENSKDEDGSVEYFEKLDSSVENAENEDGSVENSKDEDI